MGDVKCKVQEFMTQKLWDTLYVVQCTYYLHEAIMWVLVQDSWNGNKKKKQSGKNETHINLAKQSLKH